MHHRIEPPARKHRVEGGPVGQVGLHQLAAEQRVAITAGQVVESEHLVPMFEQHLDHMRADIACPAHHQYVHEAAFAPAIGTR